MSVSRTGINRRTLLAGAAALPMGATGAFAAADMLGIGTTRFNRFGLGGFEVTALLAGTRTVENPHAIFGINASDEDFAAAAAAANIPTEAAQFFFTPTVVNTGAELVLFDTGLTVSTVCWLLGGYVAGAIALESLVGPEGGTLRPRYNVAPSQPVLTVVPRAPDTDGTGATACRRISSAAS